MKPTHKIGEVCAKHPELNGERYQVNGVCLKCNTEKAHAIRHNRDRSITRHFGKICVKHPELKGERLVSNHSCPRCLFERGTASGQRMRQLVAQVERLRRAVFDHYGNECARCGINDQDVLTIDHIDQDGAEHRTKENIKSGTGFYRWLRKNNYPVGFRTLCYNCNVKAYREHVRQTNR
jgi:hypothetical protein